MCFFNNCKNRNKGFTLTELIIAIVIIGVLVGIAIPSVIHYFNHSRTVRLNNIAKSIFLAAQTELTNMKNSGTLSDISEFSVLDGRLILDGGYLLGQHNTAGKLDNELVPYLDIVNQDAIYYLTLALTGEDDPCLTSLLDNIDMSTEVLEHSVCIEFNAGTGNVLSAFYSDRFDTFTYDNSDNQNNLMKFREPSTERGVYTVDTSGTMGLNLGINIESPKIVLTDGLHEDGSGNPNSLYCEAYIVDDEIMHTIEIIDEHNAPIMDSDSLPYALSFIGNEIRETGFEWASTFQYEDLEGDRHAGSIIDGYSRKTHAVYRPEELFDPSGGTVKSHHKITWILDAIDDNNEEITFKNSIHVKYPDINIRNISLKLSLAENDSTYFSNTAHSYYAFADDSSYYVKDARHFSNLRYVATNAESIIKNFAQIGDVDLSPIMNFAPLNWIPLNGQIAKDGVFTGNYSGKKDDTTSFLISNARINTNSIKGSEASDTGVFGVVVNSNLTGVSIYNAEITTKKGGNIGAIAGTVTGTRISYASASANVRIIEDNYVNDYQVVNAGGLVGTMDKGSIELSYNSGGYWANNFGVVSVSGKYSKEINVGGLAGNVLSGTVSASYNNARVNVDSATLNSSRQIEVLKYSQINYTRYKDISMGGIAGKNQGTIRYCYSTNFVGDYYEPLDEANCGTIIGWNIGQSFNCVGLYNGLPYEMLGLNISGDLISKDELKQSLDVLGSSFEHGNLASVPGMDYHLASNYPYPVLRNNRQVFDWEDIYSPIGFELIGDLYFQTPAGRVDPTTDKTYRKSFVKVNMTDPGAVNYIDNLRIDVKYKGFSPFYARVRLDLFTVNYDTGQYLQPNSEDLEYDKYVGPSPNNELSWISNFKNDGSYYYTVALRPNDNNNYTVLPFVVGAVNTFKPANVDTAMYIKVVASGVEPLRFNAFWSLDKLPWR